MYYIGMDVGGTNLAAGLVDESLHIIYRKNAPTDPGADVEAMAKQLAELAQELVTGSGVARESIAGIGLGVPGTANRRTGRIEYANNLPFCQGDLKKRLEELTGWKVCFDNDANGAAWGEYLVYGPKAESFVMVTLGTGVGCGIILNGKLVRGVNDAAGEIGHMTISAGKRKCTCGRTGCLEMYASAAALVKQAKKKMEKKKNSRLWELCEQDPEKLDGRLFFEAVRQGDKAAGKVLDKYTDYLSEGLLNLINLLQPDVICIGGGISRAGDLFIPLLEEKVRARVYSRDSAENTRIVAARLGNDAGIIGAAMLHLCDGAETEENAAAGEKDTEERKSIWKSIIRR